MKGLSLMCRECFERVGDCDVEIRNHIFLEVNKKMKIIFGCSRNSINSRVNNIGVFDFNSLKFEREIEKRKGVKKNKITDIQVLENEESIFIVSSYVSKDAYERNFYSFLVFSDFKNSWEFTIHVPSEDMSVSRFQFIDDCRKVIFADQLADLSPSETNRYSDRKTGNVLICENLSLSMNYVQNYIEDTSTVFPNPKIIGNLKGGCSTEFIKLESKPSHLAIGGQSDVYIIDTSKGIMEELINGDFLFSGDNESRPHIFGLQRCMKSGNEVIFCGFGNRRSECDNNNNMRAIVEFDVEERIVLRKVNLFRASFSSMLYIGNSHVLLGIGMCTSRSYSTEQIWNDDEIHEEDQESYETGQIFLMSLNTGERKLVSVIHEEKVEKITLVGRGFIVASSDDALAVYSIIGKDILNEQMEYDTKERVMFLFSENLQNTFCSVPFKILLRRKKVISCFKCFL